MTYEYYTTVYIAVLDACTILTVVEVIHLLYRYLLYYNINMTSFHTYAWAMTQHKIIDIYVFCVTIIIVVGMRVIF